MKYLVLASLVFLAACVEDGDDLTNKHNTITICLDGVEYWMINPDTQSQTMAPRVNPDTLTFIRCEAK